MNIDKAYKIIGKNLGKNRWKNVSKEERSKFMKEIGAKGKKNRWANKTKEEKSAYMKKLSELSPRCQKHEINTTENKEEV